MRSRPLPHSTVALLFLLSALLNSLIHPPVYLSWLAWVANIPFILACDPRSKPRRLALTAFLVSTVYWIINLQWLAPITAIGWITFCLYTALIAPMLALSIRFCRRRGWPLSLCAALLWVGAEQFQGIFLGGFAWRFLAHSQFQNLSLIQIADITGAAGVSFLVALVNGLGADLWLHRQLRHHRKTLMVQGGITLLLLTAVLTYGHWRLQQAPTTCRPGPRIGMVQSNVPQDVKDSPQASDQILDDLLDLSRACKQAGAEVIIWPETMIQAVLDPNVWYYMDANTVLPWMTMDRQLRLHALEGSHLLVGNLDGRVEPDYNGQLKFRQTNSLTHYRPDGTRYAERYDKIHLVLFGEYLPLRYSMPWLHQLFITVSPYNFDYSLARGSIQTVFHLTDTNDTTSRCGAIICYEDTFPNLSRSYGSHDPQHGKTVDWLACISNDGWFVRFDKENQRVKPSAELAQHVAIAVFRAVESRLSQARSVNVGISCIIDSTGAIRSGYEAASPDFPQAALERQGMAGWFVDQITMDERVTFFSRWGPWLDILGLLSLTVLGAITILPSLHPDHWPRLRRRKK